MAKGRENLTHRERAINGLLFNARDAELMKTKHKAHELCREYNTLNERDPKRQKIVKDLLGKSEKDIYLMGPIQFNYGCNTRIGKHFFANFNFTVLDDGPVTIGDHVMIGPNVSIMCASHPFLYGERENMVYPDGQVGMSEFAPKITIGSHVWIACGVIVCGGVKIGDGAVIGAGSVVTKDIPAGWFACGTPCKPVRPITEADSRLDLL